MLLSQYKNQITSHIYEYTSRREKYKIKYGINSDKYKSLSSNINKKLSNYKRRYKRIELIEDKLNNWNNNIIDNYGVTLLNIGKKLEHNELKHFFCKYAMEHNVNGMYIKLFFNLVGDRTISRARMRITKKIRENKDIKSRYESFKRCIES